MLPTQAGEAVLTLCTHYGFNSVKCTYHVTGTGKAESNYEEKKKIVEYWQTEYVMKVIIGD